MTEKEKLAYIYSKTATDDFSHIPRQIIRQNAYLAGFEAAKRLMIDIVREVDLGDGDYIWTEITNLGDNNDI